MVLLLSKKVKFKKIFLINILVVVIFLGLNCFQRVVWQNTPVVMNIRNLGGETHFIDININKEKIKNVVSNCIYNPIVATNVELSTRVSSKTGIVTKLTKLQKIGLCNKFIISMFLIIACIFTIKNFRRNFSINFGIILALLFNLLLHIIYGNGNCFLYSMHTCYLIFLLFGINSLNKNNKVENISVLLSMTLLLVLEILMNGKVFVKILKILKDNLQPNYYIKNLGIVKTIILTVIVIITLSIILRLIYCFAKKIKISKKTSDKCKYLIYMFVLLIIFESTFVSIQTVSRYEKNPLNIMSINTGSAIKSNLNYRSFSDKFGNEVDSYLEYLAEYREFIEKYECVISNNIPDVEFYLFGLGNRRKILFKDNKLIDIEKDKVIKEFEIKKYLIIPNEYMVLIKQKDGKFKKIYENEDGVFIESDDKNEIIEGTNISINLYSFDEQEYKNIKKVLYSEILFNIKDSKLYPNIFVYDKPCYRDAAIACLVLKQTNNTDLISEWVSTITNVYDEQNGGIKEPDNLGELLYIISTQEDRNTDLIKKIKNEAERLANENPNGYYIYGLTDGAQYYKYQNLWYEFGMNSIGEKSEFDYKKLEDKYENLIWWMKNNKSKKSIYKDKMFPYLTWANFHASDKKGLCYVSDKIYPLSWEKGSEFADYDKMKIIDEKFMKSKVSPTHIWTASEMLLFILDETQDLTIMQSFMNIF